MKKYAQEHRFRMGAAQGARHHKGAQIARLAGFAAAATAAALFSTSGHAGHLSGYAAPTGLVAGASGSSITLHWNAYSADNFPANCTTGREIRIQKQVNGGGFNMLTATGESSTSYTDENLANGDYEYRIQARCNVPPIPSVSPADTNNLSAFSNVAAATIASAPACSDAPSVSASATPTLLWPPNGKMVPVTVTGTVTAASNCSLPENVVYGVADEYGELGGSWVNWPLGPGGTFSFTVNLEASRLGSDPDGRLYQIHVNATDQGYTGTTYVNVIVPHDQRKK
jgi:hypothetical protein